jgi:hypothetical protein
LFAATDGLAGAGEVSMQLSFQQAKGSSNNNIYFFRPWRCDRESMV